MSVSLSNAGNPPTWEKREQAAFLDPDEPYIYVLLSGQSNAEGFQTAFGQPFDPDPSVEAWDDQTQSWVTAELGKAPFTEDRFNDRGQWQAGTHYHPTIYNDRGDWEPGRTYFASSFTDRGIWQTGETYNPLDEVQDSLGRERITYAGGVSAGDDSDLVGGSDTGVVWYRKGYPDKVRVNLGTESEPEYSFFVTFEGGVSAGDNSDLAGGSDTGVTWFPFGNPDRVSDSQGTYFVTNSGGLSAGSDSSLLTGSDTGVIWLSDSHANNIGFVLAKGLAAHYGKTVRLLKPAWGANPIENWLSDLAPPSGVGAAGLKPQDGARPARFSEIETQLEEAGIPRLDLVVWMQLESNSAKAASVAKAPGTPNAPDPLRAGGLPNEAANNDLYRSRLRLLIDRFRTSRWGRADLPFIACQGVTGGNQDDRNQVLAELDGDPDAALACALTREAAYPLPDYTALGLPARFNRDLDQLYPGPDSVDFAHHSAAALSEIAQRVLDRFIKLIGE